MLGVSRLLGVAAVVVIIVVVAALFLFVRPEFDEPYVRSLLARHDPTLPTDTWEDFDVIDETGESINETTAIEGFVDPEFGYGRRDATVVKEVGTEKVIRGELNYVASETLDIGTADRLFACPDNTTIEIVTQETPDYLYLAAAGDGISRMSLEFLLRATGFLPPTEPEELEEEPTFLPEDPMIDYTPEDAESVIAPIRRNLAKVKVTRIWYFRPGDREEFNRQLEPLLQLASGCEEVTV